MIKYFKAIFLLLLITSCDKKESKTSTNLENNISLAVVDSLLVQIPDSIQPPQLLNKWNYTNHNLSYLYPEGNDNFALVNTTIPKGDWSKLTLPKEGPNGIGLEGNFAIAANQIFYFPSITSSIYVMNLKGEINSKFLFDPDLKIFAGPDSKLDFKIKDSTIYFEATYYSSLAIEDTFEDTKIVGIYDFEKDSFKTIIHYPEEFHKNTWSPHDSDRTVVFQDDKIVVNFSKSHSIYVYDYEGTLLEKVEMRHPFVDDATGRDGGDSFSQALKHESTGSYTNLVYDPYRKLYYRFASFYGEGNIDIKTKQEMHIAIKQNQLSIITFNENFEKLAVNDFAFKEYGLVDYFTFVNEKGLHVKCVRGEIEGDLNFSILTPQSKSQKSL